jgi:hypothetical protein
MATTNKKRVVKPRTTREQEAWAKEVANTGFRLEL